MIAEGDSYQADDVLVLDGAKLKSLIKDYARECIREELASMLKLLSQSKV